MRYCPQNLKNKHLSLSQLLLCSFVDMPISAMMILLNVFFDERNILSIKVHKVDIPVRDSSSDKCHHKHLYWMQSVILNDNPTRLSLHPSKPRRTLYKSQVKVKCHKIMLINLQPLEALTLSWCISTRDSVFNY